MPSANGRSWNLSEQSKVAGREGTQAQAERAARPESRAGAGPADVCSQEVEALGACEQVWSPCHSFLELADTELQPAPQETLGIQQKEWGKVLKTTPSKQCPAYSTPYSEPQGHVALLPGPGNLPHSHGRVLEARGVSLADGECDCMAAVNGAPDGKEKQHQAGWDP